MSMSDYKVREAGLMLAISIVLVLVVLTIAGGVFIGEMNRIDRNNRYTEQCRQMGGISALTSHGVQMCVRKDAELMKSRLDE